MSKYIVVMKSGYSIGNVAIVLAEDKRGTKYKFLESAGFSDSAYIKLFAKEINEEMFEFKEIWKYVN